MEVYAQIRHSQLMLKPSFDKRTHAASTSDIVVEKPRVDVRLGWSQNKEAKKEGIGRSHVGKNCTKLRPKS